MNCVSIPQWMCLELVQSKDMTTLAFHKDSTMETYFPDENSRQICEASSASSEPGNNGRDITANLSCVRYSTLTIQAIYS
jgi:hypothetical protein